MHIISAVVRDFLIYFSIKRRQGRIHLGVLLCAIIIGLVGYEYIANNSETGVETASDTYVDVAAVSALMSGSHVTAVGSVQSVSEATVVAEAPGRLTSVRVQLGDQIAAGTVIATIENAAQQAAVLQAEGAYDAAVAAAQGGDIRVSEAQTAVSRAYDSARNTYASSYTTVSNVVYGVLDPYYGNPNDYIPGLRFSASTDTRALNDNRVTLQTSLPAWQAQTRSNLSDKETIAALEDAQDETNLVLSMVDLFIFHINADYNSSQFSQSERASISATLATSRASLASTLDALRAANTSITSAQEALARTQLGGTSSSVSSANATVKQALGSLRAAQAALAKTIIRSPIAGTVNALNIENGNYVGALSPVATIANNNALELTTYISEGDRDRISIGDHVTINGQYEGTVTHIAPAINPSTKKIEVKIATQATDIANGDSARISFEGSDIVTDTPAFIAIPITALKVETDRTVVFTVDEHNTLVAHPVVVGPLLGDSIIIKDGVTSDMDIVVDARGLHEDDIVVIR